MQFLRLVSLCKEKSAQKTLHLKIYELHTYQLMSHMKLHVYGVFVCFCFLSFVFPSLCSLYRQLQHALGLKIPNVEQGHQLVLLCICFYNKTLFNTVCLYTPRIFLPLWLLEGGVDIGVAESTKLRVFTQFVTTLCFTHKHSSGDVATSAFTLKVPVHYSSHSGTAFYETYGQRSLDVINVPLGVQCNAYMGMWL